MSAIKGFYLRQGVFFQPIKNCLSGFYPCQGVLSTHRKSALSRFLPLQRGFLSTHLPFTREFLSTHGFFQPLNTSTPSKHTYPAGPRNSGILSIPNYWALRPSYLWIACSSATYRSPAMVDPENLKGRWSWCLRKHYLIRNMKIGPE